MRKYLFLLLITALLTGCGAEETFETVMDELAAPVIAQPRFICVDLPGETALPVVENQNGRVYICNDYEIVIQTLESGNLEETMQIMTGLTPEDLTVMETFSDGVNRYEFVWAAAGRPETKAAGEPFWMTETTIIAFLFYAAQILTKNPRSAGRMCFPLSTSVNTAPWPPGRGHGIRQ